MNVVGFPCKGIVNGENCSAWLAVQTLAIPDDTARAMYVPVNVDDDPATLTCPDCKQTHEYEWRDHEIRPAVGAF